ncbi:hypothetical protein B0T19DRAFT_419648 [Cercophora scortea]|uniref:Uncharacterized protein n=1 Tax=Cercophora scortea TaxID=314031 RepID=A0AAE0IZ79_9PEZI|nr:hypothetical protein B0T19DRAFT_419648 [Cercophora scortea]
MVLDLICMHASSLSLRQLCFLSTCPFMPSLGLLAFSCAKTYLPTYLPTHLPICPHSCFARLFYLVPAHVACYQFIAQQSKAKQSVFFSSFWKWKGKERGKGKGFRMSCVFVVLVLLCVWWRWCSWVPGLSKRPCWFQRGIYIFNKNKTRKTHTIELWKWCVCVCVFGCGGKHVDGLTWVWGGWKLGRERKEGVFVFCLILGLCQDGWMGVWMWTVDWVVWVVRLLGGFTFSS